MPITIHTNKLQVKNSNGEYDIIDAVSDTTVAEHLAAVESAIQTKGAETLASIPESYTNLSNDIDELKNALMLGAEQITGNQPIAFEYGHYISATTSPSEGQQVSFEDTMDYACAISPCQKGDIFYAHVYGFSYANRAYFICASDMTILAYAASKEEVNGAIQITQDDAAYIVFNNRLANLSSRYYVVKGGTLLRNEVDELKNTVGCNAIPVTWDADSDGKYIGENGTIGSSTNFHYSDLLPAYPGEACLTFDYSGTQMGVRIHGYNVAGVWIKQIGNVTGITTHTTIPFTITADISFIRISISKLVTNLTLFECLPGEIEKAGNEINMISHRLGRINLFDKDGADVEQGKYISSTSDGTEVWTIDASFCETGFIPVVPGSKIAFFYVGRDTVPQLYHVWYTSTKTVISGNGQLPSNKCYTVPDNAYYFRTAYALSRESSCMVITIKDDDVLPFDPSGEVYTPFNGLTLPYIVKEMNIGQQWEGKKCYCYGTSITSVHQGTGKYPTYLAQLSKMVITEKGIGGQGIGDLGATSTGQVYDAICNITDGKLEADLIIIETGANDCNANVPLGTIYDTGRTTLSGCLNDCLRYLQANTDAQIVVTNSPSATSTPTATTQYYEWAKIVREICDINRVHFISPNNNMGSAKLADSEKGSLYVVDSIHQTDLGGYIMAENIWYHLRNIPLFYTAIPS